MPTYGYRCEANGHEFEVFQRMTDQALSTCQVCGSPVRRIFYPVGIVFKGPGFYKTDSRGGSSVPAGTASGEKAESGGKSEPAGGEKKSSGKDMSDSPGKSESKPKKESRPKSAGDKKSA